MNTAAYLLAGRLGNNNRRRLGFGITLDILLFELRKYAPELNAAVTDRCIKILYRIAVLTAHRVGKKFFKLLLGNMDIQPFEFGLKLISALNYIFVTFFTLESKPDLAPCFTCLDYIQPVTLGAALFL